MTGFVTAAADLAAHYRPYAWFAVIWTMSLALVCATGVVLANRSGPKPVVGAIAGGAARPRPLWLALAATAFVPFITVYSFLIPYHEDLVGLDYSTVTARPFAAVPIWPSTGRFFPLALQEYNLLGVFGRSAALYHAFSIVELLVLVVCVFRILDGVPGWLRCCATLFLLVLPSFVVSFFGIVYPERDMVVWLALWLVCWRAFDHTGSRGAFCGALIAAQFALYYKEPAFVLIGGFAAARLAIEVWRDRELFRRHAYGAFGRAHALEIAHLALCAVFVIVYSIVVAGHVTSSYAANADTPRAVITALAGYAGSDLLVDAFIVAFIGRMVYLATARRALDPLWDALPVGALAYAFAFVKLGLTRDYYLAPTDFVGVLYVTRFGYAGLRQQRQLVPAAVALLAGLMFQHNVSDAAHRLLNRKQYVQGNVQLVSFLTNYSRSHGDQALALYFPHVGGFELMELSSFLQLKGFRATGVSTDGSPAAPRFVVKSAHRFPNDLCLPSEAFRCVHAPAPAAGDLVVYLPGRELPRPTLDSIRTTSVELFHYHPAASQVERALIALASSDRLADQNPEISVFEYARVARQASSAVGPYTPGTATSSRR